jgi:hypothetical protein
MTKRALVLTFAMAAAAVPLLSAQSNEVLDAVLSEATLSYAQAAYLVGTASGHFADTVSPQEAVTDMEQQGLGTPGLKPDDPVNLGAYSYMLTRAFGIKGGIMYRILPGPRYATRELSYLKIIPGPAKPGMSLSGDLALRILQHMLDRKGAAQ